MITTRSRKVFINLPVKDLKRTVEFFTKLGFKFDPRFTDANATCMILSEEAYVMLLVEPFFRTLMNNSKEICDTSKSVEAFLGISADSRAEVDEIVKTAVEAGGKHATPAEDHGFCYGWSFYDLDGHAWSVNYMDMEAVAKMQAAEAAQAGA